MKSKNILAALLIILWGVSCQPDKKSSVPEFIEIDVTKKYPVKELVLDELAEIEYILPVVHDDYLYRGFPRCVTDQYIIIFEMTSSDILVFNRNGHPSHKFNKRGDGPGEYQQYLFSILYDENQDELFVMADNKIHVYSIRGDYKRTLNLKEGTFIANAVLFDEYNLLCYDNYEEFPTPFFLLSRQDGSITEGIDIRYEEKIQVNSRKEEGDVVFVYTGPTTNIVKAENGFILTDYSVDSVYLYTYEHQLIPVLKRTPPIASQNPYIYLNSYLESSSYLFMTTVSTEFNWVTREGFAETNLFMDKKDGKLYEQRILLDEYKGKELSISPGVKSRITGQMDGIFLLRSEELQQAFDENKLSGRLKEIVSKMEEEPNDLLLLFKFK